jgi:hypothetical protein
MSSSTVMSIDLDRISYLTSLMNSHELMHHELEELKALQKVWLLNSEIAEGSRDNEIKRSYK